MNPSKLSSWAPGIILAMLIAVWSWLGVHLVLQAPFASGTDESINYVALAAAKNRWATEDDFQRYRIDYFYYPPLYYLLFAPWYGDDPAFTTGYPRGPSDHPNYRNRSGRVMKDGGFLAGVPPTLTGLYRSAKLVSLACGLTAILALAGTLALLFPGPSRWWAVLLGTAPLVLLPQFLYYHTLCNNDPLVNALAGLSVLFFAWAVVSREKRRPRRFFLLSLGVSALTGLALMTKLTGVMLLILPLFLAAVRHREDRGVPAMVRLCRDLAFLAIQMAVVIAAGGWWIVRQALLGDWNSSRAHRLAHPWAFGQHDLTDFSWMAEQVLGLARSYFGLFMGMSRGLPDRIAAFYFLLPLLGLGAIVAALVLGIRRRGPAGESGRRSRVILWGCLGCLVAFNVILILANLVTGAEAAYGRLMFPSAVASHALFALAGVSVFGRFRNLLPAVTVALTVFLGILFGWTWRHRLLPAVRQSPEDVRVLSTSPRPPDAPQSVFRPAWRHRIDQAVVLPAGTVTGIRVWMERTSLAPQFGARLTGTLSLEDAAGGMTTVRFEPFPLGDGDVCYAWPEVRLERQVRLAAPARGTVTLEATPPHRWSWPVEFMYVVAPAGSGGSAPAFRDGHPSGYSLCLAAVYARPSPRSD